MSSPFALIESAVGEAGTSAAVVTCSQPIGSPVTTCSEDGMHTGGCFCGAVHFTVGGALTGVTYCHCSKCRRWHGHAGAYTAADRDDFRLTETRGLAWHSVSSTVRRAFCSVCGSSLLFDDSSDPKMGICAGSIDEPTGLRETAHIFVASKGDYYQVPPGLPAHDTIPRRAK